MLCIVHRMIRSIAFTLLFAACIAEHGATPGDASPTSPDVTPALGHHHYVIDSIQLPANNAEARLLGQDVDGDLVIDNQLGMVLAASETMGFAVQPTLTESLARGASITLLDVTAKDFAADPAATLATFVGTSPMPAACAGDGSCAHHLAGDATFVIEREAARDPALAAVLAAGTLTALPGPIALPVPAMFGGDAMTVSVIGARITASRLSAAKVLSIRIAGGIPSREIDATVLPALGRAAQSAIGRDCSAPTHPPACGCAPGSRGELQVRFFDQAPSDCQVTTSELRESPLVQSLLRPDILIDGQPVLSFGYSATAVSARFAEP